MSGPRYRLTLEAAPAPHGAGEPAAPPEVRLRSALKVLWRALGLRCRSVEELAADAPPQCQAGAGREIGSGDGG
jgi:hypothetical protein